MIQFLTILLWLFRKRLGEEKFVSFSIALLQKPKLRSAS